MRNKEFYQGKVVVVTGSGKGIGKSTAKMLGENGAKVVLNGRSSKSLLQTEAKFTKLGIECFAVQADISVEAEAKKLIDEAVNHFGRIDVVINNAGIAIRGLFSEMELSVWNNVIQTNLMSYIYVTHFALPYLKQTKGSIVFISSIGGRAGLPGHGAYSVSKMPLNSLVQTLDIELQADQIHAGIVYVGFTRNDPEKTIIDGSGGINILPKRNESLLMEPEKVAEAILILIRKRKRQKVLSPIGHLQTIFYNFPVIRRLIMRNMLQKYYSMYPK